jgi:hypothetical protein
LIVAILTDPDAGVVRGFYTPAVEAIARHHEGRPDAGISTDALNIGSDGLLHYHVGLASVMIEYIVLEY